MDAWIGDGIAIGALLVEGVAVVAMSNRTINHVLANRQLVKLVTAGNLARAVKLCGAGGPKTYLAVVRSAILAGARAGIDPATIRETAKTTYEAEARTFGAAYRNAAILGIVMTIVALAGCGFVVAQVGVSKAGGPALGIGLVALFLGIGFALRAGKFTAAIADTRHHVLPMMIEALVTGPPLEA